MWCRRHVGPHVDASCIWSVPVHSLHPTSTRCPLKIPSDNALSVFPGSFWFPVHAAKVAVQSLVRYSAVLRPYHVLISSSYAIPALKCYSVSNFFGAETTQRRGMKLKLHESSKAVFFCLWNSRKMQINVCELARF